MEDIIFQTYGTFVLTLAGFVLPLIAIAISAFPEGVKTLRQTYENEQRQSEKNLAEELKKQQEGVNVDYEALAENINTLKKTKQRAEGRLRFLNPGYIFLTSTLAISVSIFSFLISLALYQAPFYISEGLLVLSVASTVWAVKIFFISVGIITEAASAVQNSQKTTNEKIVELLTTLADNTDKDSASLFIKPEDIHIFFDDDQVTPGKVYSFSVGKKHKVNISLKNLSSYMFKTAELGFSFPAEFLIENTGSVYVGEKEKIIRFKHDYLQANVNQIQRPIEITFLNAGVFSATAFVKGENLKNNNINFKIKVVK